MPIVIVCRGHIGPSSTSKSSEETSAGDDGWEVRVRSPGEEIEERYKSESRSRGDGDKDHED